MPFKMQNQSQDATQPKKRFKARPVKDISLHESSWAWLEKATIKPAPLDVKQDFDWTCDQWMSFDVETHDLAPDRHERGWTCGEFGHNRLKYNVDAVCALRAV